jgi:hypothetical protein
MLLLVQEKFNTVVVSAESARVNDEDVGTDATM